MIEKGLIIDSPHIDRILAGRKTWEMRSRSTSQRALIGLIKKGSGCVVGVARIVDSLGPFDDVSLIATQDKHLMSEDRIRRGEVAKYRFAWVLTDINSFKAPIAYRHPSGAVIWVNLDPAVATRVHEAATG